MRLKNEFTEGEKYHNLMNWLISCSLHKQDCPALKGKQIFVIVCKIKKSELKFWKCKQNCKKVLNILETRYGVGASKDKMPI